MCVIGCRNELASIQLCVYPKSEFVTTCIVAHVFTLQFLAMKITQYVFTNVNIYSHAHSVHIFNVSYE